MMMARRGMGGRRAENGIGEATESGAVQSRGERDEEKQQAVVANADKEKKKKNWLR